MSDHTLILRLSAPWQSWGVSSRFSKRDTRSEPTKSGVVGILAAALGRERKAPIADLAELKFGVRIDQKGTLEKDYQTASRGKTVLPITDRYYLADAKFVVGLEGDLEFLKIIETALKNPVYPIYLGRRCSTPDEPFVLGIFDLNLEEALRNIPWQASDWYKKTLLMNYVSLPIKRDAEENEVGIQQRDTPISFDSENRQYGWRKVFQCEPLMVKNDLYKEDIHDPFVLIDQLNEVENGEENG